MEEVYAGADILFHEAYRFDPKTNPYDAKAPVSISCPVTVRRIVRLAHTALFGYRFKCLLVAVELWALSLK